MKIVCVICGKKVGEKEPLDDKSETQGRCSECLKKFVSGFTPEKYQQLVSQMREHIDQLKADAPPDEKQKSLINFSQFLLSNYDFLNDEGREMCDKLSKDLIYEFQRTLEAAPDSKEVRQMKRHLKGASGKRLRSDAYIKSLQELPEDPPKFYLAARELFEKHMQHVMDLWSDITQGNMLSGARQFCDAGLAGLCIEELLVASHLFQHSFGSQGFAHIRAAREALDLMDLFKKHPDRVEIFIGDDEKKKWNKLRPSQVRKTLQKDEASEKFYEHFSEIGSHPTFRALQERVKRMVKDEAGGRPTFLFTVGGTIKSGQHWLVTPVLFLTLTELATRIVDSFPQFLNGDDCRHKIEEMSDDIQKYQEDHIFKPLRENGSDISKIEAASKKSFEKMKTAFRQPE